MNQINTIPSTDELRTAARAKVVKTLSEIPIYRVLSPTEQKDIYLSMMDEYFGKEKAKYGLDKATGFSKSMATDSGKEMGYKGYDPGFSGDTQSFKELVDSVDFPSFVKDLLKAVFDANVVVMKQQTDSYIKLMKEATKSSADFIKQIKDEESFARLAETRGDKYNVISERQQ